MEIKYETNVMASGPRKFESYVLNLENNNYEKMVNVEPVYNDEKQCY